MRRLLFALPFFLLTLQAQPQSVPAQVTIGESTVALTGPWKFHTGDNPAWASPNFDDSSWGTMDLTPSGVDPNTGTGGFVPGWTARGYAGYSGYAWYRLRVNVTQQNTRDANEALAIGMPREFDDAYQVYVNSQRIGQFGRFTQHGVTYYIGEPRSFSLPRNLRTGVPLTIAIRMWMHPSTLQSPGAGGMHGPPLIGRTSAIGTHLDLDGYAFNRLYASIFLQVPIFLLALLVAFVLYWLDRGEPAYLWLGLTFVDSLVFYLYILAFAWVRPGSFLDVTLRLTITAVIGFWVVFWGYWFRLGRMARLHGVVWGLVLPLLVVVAMRHALFANRMVPAQAAAWLSPLHVVLNILLVALLLWVAYRGIRKAPLEGWLALPAVLLIAISRFQSGNLASGRMVFLPYGIPVHLGQVANILALIIITVLMLRRFLQGQQERARIRAEFQQARSVQEMLIPQHSVQVPGFDIESVYIPASEVGGDFFQVLPSEDGSLLIVVGDVSGKGLKAAMTVSAIVGALRGCTLRKPFEVLAYLNRVLHGQITGFVTCAAALIDPEGEVILANAGNPAPYRNGEELPVDSGLPLGILAESNYSETTHRLEPGDRLTFVSDGVVEATNEKKELFGFDRTQAISDQPANAIAAAAQQFGQQDDISVLSITRAPSLKAALA